MSRGDMLDPLARVAALRRIVDEMKSAQRVGPKGLLGYVTRSSASNDYSFGLGPNATRSFTLTFKHDHAKKGSVQQLSMFYSLDDPNVASGFYPAWANGPPVSVIMQKLPPTDTENRWRFYVVNNGSLSHDVYFKFHFSGTDSGVWTIT
jgi:hypothetical protein